MYTYQPIDIVIPKHFTLFTYYTKKNPKPGCPVACLMEAANIRVPFSVKRDSWNISKYENELVKLIATRYSYNEDEIAESINRLVFDVDDQGDQLKTSEARDELAQNLMTDFVLKYPRAFRVVKDLYQSTKKKKKKR